MLAPVNPQSVPPLHPPQRLRRVITLFSLPLLLGGFWLGGQEGVLGAANHVGYAVCHQITVRSYVFGDMQLPLCARCTGQYLGVFSGLLLAWRWGRLGAGGFPPMRYLLMLAAFFGAWGFDGFNSYISLLLGHPWLYQPHNTLRLVTGMMQGYAVSFLLIPYFNQVFWAESRPEPVLQRSSEVVQMGVLGGLVVLAVASRWPPLFYPLAILSSGAAFMMLSIVGQLLFLLFLREENKNHSWRDFLSLLAPGMVFAVMLIGAIDLARGAAEAALGWQLPGR